MTQYGDENLVQAKPRMIGDKQVGALGFGCWRLVGDDVADATARIETALELGMTLIDNADIYGLDWGGQAFGESEALLGKVLAANPRLRDEIVLASKGGIIVGLPYHSGADYLTSAVNASLARLQTEHIDLYKSTDPTCLPIRQKPQPPLMGWSPPVKSAWSAYPITRRRRKTRCAIF